MPSFVFFSVLFGSYEEILCLWHHPEVSFMFAYSSYTVTVWKGVKHLFFLSFSFVDLGTQLFVEKIGNNVKELQNRITECFLGLSASLDFKKKVSKSEKQQRDLSRRETVAKESHLQNRLSGNPRNRTFAGCPVLATLGRIQWPGLACSLKQKPVFFPIARAIFMSFI